MPAEKEGVWHVPISPEDYKALILVFGVSDGHSQATVYALLLLSKPKLPECQFSVDNQVTTLVHYRRKVVRPITLPGLITTRIYFLGNSMFASRPRLCICRAGFAPPFFNLAPPASAPSLN